MNQQLLRIIRASVSLRDEFHFSIQLETSFKMNSIAQPYVKHAEQAVAEPVMLVRNPSALPLLFSIDSILGPTGRSSPPSNHEIAASGSFPLSSPNKKDPEYHLHEVSDSGEGVQPEYEPTNAEEATKKKRNRTKFSPYQLQELKRAFAESTYLSYATENDLIWRLGLTTKHVRTWFQNRRYKQKRKKEAVSINKHGTEAHKISANPTVTLRSSPIGSNTFRKCHRPLGANEIYRMAHFPTVRNISDHVRHPAQASHVFIPMSRSVMPKFYHDCYAE